MTDRDQVAREVLTELAHWKMARVETLKDATRFRDERYPAPAAPVTVTVDGGSWIKHPHKWWRSAVVGTSPTGSDADTFLDRIASDAQVIAAKDKRIAELEREVEELRDDARTADDARGNLLLQTICRLPDVLTTGDWQEWLDEHRHQWLNDDRAFGGWVAERLSAHMTRVERERDEARRLYAESEATSQGERLGAPASTSDEAPNSEVTGGGIAAASPAPIPLGAVVEVSGITYQRTEVGDWSSAHRWISRNSHEANTLDALYRALHPVADAATVKRVALRVKQYNGPTAVSAEGFARIILEELGYTIQEGA
jgi:outer membrane murein-binding lipoprotein Lpp